MSKKPYVIGICGGTCSGKSTLSGELEKTLGDKYTLSVFHMDKYYRRPQIRTIAPITRVEYVEANHPDSLETDSLYKDFFEAVSNPDNDIVIIEGLFSFYLDQIREKLDLKVYVDLKSDERMYRRIRRWMERQTMEDIVNRYLDTVRYRHDEFVEPMRWHADIVLNGTLDTNQGTGILISFIETQVSLR